jgi:hypothetical protein
MGQTLLFAREDVLGNSTYDANSGFGIACQALEMAIRIARRMGRGNS